MEHTEVGAFGLVLNRVTETSAGEVLDGLEDLLDYEEEMYVGGPVQPSSVVVLGEFEDPEDAALIAFDHVGVLAGGSEPPQRSTGVRQARAFAGHSGWGPGQLDEEIERGDWILESAHLADAFCSDAEALWGEVLTRKGGSFALLARMPSDPSVN